MSSWLFLVSGRASQEFQKGDVYSHPLGRTGRAVAFAWRGGLANRLKILHVTNENS